MYGCDCHIGCLSGEVKRIGGELDGFATRACSELSGNVNCISQGLKGCVSLVCTLSKDAYLRVSTEVLWLTPDMLGEEFDIYSNVVWKID